MSAGDILCLALAGVPGLGVVSLLVHGLVEDTRQCLWPRGLRWFPPAWDRLEDRLERALWVFWPERRELLPSSRRTRHLEELDEHFRQAVELYGVWPEWKGKGDLHGYWFAYGRTIDICPCGYVAECGIWCGDGHETGRCPENHHPMMKRADG